MMIGEKDIEFLNFNPIIQCQLEGAPDAGIMMISSCKSDSIRSKLELTASGVLLGLRSEIVVSYAFQLAVDSELDSEVKSPPGPSS